ncbi:hypothetical protein LNO23_16260 [Klebsiella pneumoniae subsp. pneumoniae]|nr:hypothetical protein [Klebsiella pneumoniae subsp. pneumoniae]MCS5855867.1 hypothetical protein [Klebsiella pneumoniae subsp. pneumoniae]
MLVQTESDRWVIPPQRALWLPPLHIHSYHLLSQTDLRAIYFSSSLIAECTSFTKSQQVHVDHGYAVSQRAYRWAVQ